jgi:2-dehydropantoate 2-reductase
MSRKLNARKLNILIYGAGALGQALGCMLSQAGNKVDLLLRERFIDVLKNKGLEVEGVLGTFKADMENVGLLKSLYEAQSAYDYILITTKSYDTKAAVQDIAASPSQPKNIVSLQNGCGNLEKLVEAFGTERSLGGRVITGFEILSAGHINISVTADAIHIGGSVAGTIPESAHILAEAITYAGHPCLAVPDIYSSLYAKLLYNCALNPLGAILGVHYGALADNDETRKILNALIDETFAVIAASGGSTPWKKAEEYRELFYQNLIPATYNHRASMLQDLEAGKTTEVDALVGFVSEQGRKYDIPTPTCDLVAAMVRFKEEWNQGEK